MAQGREARAYNITIYVHKKSVRESTTCAAGRDAFWSGAVSATMTCKFNFRKESEGLKFDSGLTTIVSRLYS